ncbi:hypothetical protein BJX66DRAFT_176808 [Aspergillus keveii]|uniref:Uncharacterized protein n=1 Tax=Aspergillus keveii TaxID=714993 RepID=A0ABR4FH54_9EURO
MSSCSSRMTSRFPKAETDVDKQMEGSVWGFDPVTEFDSGNPNEQVEANSSIKRQSALASSEYAAKSSQSSLLPVLDVPSATYQHEPKTWATRKTDRLDTKNGRKEDDFWEFDPVLRSSANLSMKERCCGRESVFDKSSRLEGRCTDTRLLSTNLFDPHTSLLLCWWSHGRKSAQHICSILHAFQYHYNGYADLLRKVELKPNLSKRVALHNQCPR